MDPVLSSSDRPLGVPECRSRSGLDAGELFESISLTSAALRRLAGASLLVTGATGWFGTWLLDFLCAADDVLGLGIRVAAVSREPEDFLRRFEKFRGDERISWIRSDVQQLNAGSQEFSHVIHAAADSSEKGGGLSPQQQFDTIVEGTRRAIACAGPACQGFLLLSSGAVYGPAPPGAARFMDGQSGGPDPSLPSSAYAEGKRAAEQLCAIAAAGGTPVRIARCFAFVGPHMPFDRHFAIGNFIADAVKGRPIQIMSDGKPQRSYLYMSDLMRALMLILVDGGTGRTYNVGSEAGLTIKELADRVNLVVGGRGVVLGGGVSDPGNRYVPDTARLCNELEFVPAVPLDVAISRTAAWYRAHLKRSMPS
jgi:nucleoside-diphosphate-sugar epimerase